MPRTNRTKRLAEARASVEASAAKVHPDLPLAICRICGARVPAGSGSRLPEESWPDEQRATRMRQADQVRASQGQPILDDWRRQHERCEASPEGVVFALTGKRVSPAIAADVFARTGQRRRLVAVQNFGSDLMSPPPDTRRPFAWLDQAARKWVADTVARIELERSVGPSTAGACGFCGRRTSQVWHAVALTWSDGSPAPLCASCWAVWDRRTGDVESVPDIREVRSTALEALTGWSEMGGADYGLRCFAEVSEPSERGGYEQAWTYRSAVQAVTEAVWSDHPQHAPEATRDRYLRRAEQRAEAERKARTEAYQASVQIPDIWQKGAS